MKRIRVYLVVLLCVLSIAGAAAQTDSIRPGFLKSIGNRLDDKAKLKYDPLYIEVPDRPWRIILRSKLDEITTDFVNYNSFDYEDETYKTLLDMQLDSKLNKSVGLWVGYRGLGIGYYYKLGKKDLYNISISATGAKFGFNFRLRGMKYDELHAKLGYVAPIDTLIFDADAHFWEPIDAMTFYFNGYYVFNGRRYSQPAAYNQAVIQKKSAGSLLLGATAYASGINMAYNENASLIYYCDSVGTITLGKIAVGLGYGYNWVPARGWTINAMVMPNISVSDKIILSKYDCNYSMFAGQEEDDYGTWDSQNHVWENGKVHKVIAPTEGEEMTELPPDLEIWLDHEDANRTRWAFNIDLRMGVAYCWNRYFISANAIFNHFNYGRKNNTVSLNDWYATVSLGFRL